MHSDLKLYQLILANLEQQIAVINALGSIVFVNKSWIDSGIDRGIPAHFEWMGVNYLDLADSSQQIAGVKDQFAAGIRAVIAGKITDFHLEYGCDSDTERRWFNMSVTLLGEDMLSLFLISHNDISKYKLEAEEAALLSMHDSLTGLANRRYMNQFIQSEWQRAKRHHLPISVILIDIDEFKQINDALGHFVGDVSLCKVANILKNFTNRPTDLAVRLGGDEFLLVLGNTMLDDAYKIAEKLRQTIYANKIRTINQDALTVSVGVSCISQVKYAEIEDLLKNADLALYQAKTLGKNRVESMKNHLIN